MRLAITAADRLAQQRVRARERHLREAQADSDQTARELRGRIDGQRTAGMTQLEATRQPEWWDRASVADVANAWEAAQGGVARSRGRGPRRPQQGCARRSSSATVSIPSRWAFSG
jgi:hypothetical protein